MSKIEQNQETPADEIQAVIKLYQEFDKYSQNTYWDLYYHLLPSFKLKQCKVHYDNGNIIGFTNWAFLDGKAERKFIRTGEIDRDDWNSGSSVWHVDTVCKKHMDKIMAWTKSNLAKTLGTGVLINWLRVSNDNKIKRVASRLTKKSWIK
jgi:hemolysin-activating ACP:hemolysin acyltransferase